MDDSRRAALLSAAKVRLVLGAPGVGKTYFGCEIAEYELDTSLSTRPGKILFLTFARNAVARIRQSYLCHVAPPSNEAASSGRLRRFASRVELNTFAGFFWWLNEAYGRYAPGGAIGRPWLVASTRSAGIPVPAGHLAFDFEHLESEALGILGVPAVRRLISQVYPLIIVDEHQDVHTGLHDVLTFLGEESRLVLLHGEGQCIYGHMKRFDPAVMLEKAKRSFRPEVFLLTPLGEGRQRHRKEVILLITQYDSGQSCRWDGTWTRRKLVSRLTRNGHPNDLAAHALMLLRSMRSHLQSVVGNPKPTMAVLTSTNSGAVELYHRLKTGSEAYRLPPLAGTLVLNDLLMLHYGRLFLELFSVHWIAGRRLEGNEQLVSCLLSLLFQEAGTTRPPEDWLPLATTIVEHVRGQQLPRKNRSRTDKFTRDVSQVNRFLRATKANLPSGSPSTPFTKADTPLLDMFSRRLIHVLEPLLNSASTIDLTKARCLFESSMQRQIILEKQGLEHGVQVMTIHKAKGREFDVGVVVLEDNRKALWSVGSATPDAELGDLYRVAISRPRNCLGLVAFEDAAKSARGPVQQLLM